MLNHSLFLCGSLCKGMVHHKLIQDAIVETKTAKINGTAFRLQVGYPVISVEGIDTIEGELVTLKNSDIIWPLLDQFFSYKEEKADKCIYQRRRINAFTENDAIEAYTYSLNLAKLPKTATKIPMGDWRADFESLAPLTEDLTKEETVYIKKLGTCTGREIVPYTPLTRELEKRGYVVDKGRRPALTKLGKELFQFIE